MGLWTKKNREAGRIWVEENAERVVQMHVDGYSILAIQKTAPMKIGRDLIEQCLRARGLEPRGFSITLRTLEAREKTCLEKFGTRNVSSVEEVKRTREKTCLEKFGTKNAFQNVDIKKKIEQTNLVRHGHRNPGSQTKKSVKISNVHRQLSDALHIAGVEHQNEVLVQSTLDKRAPRVDILIGDLAVEVYGDYFHANPNVYSADHEIRRFGGYKKSSDIWKEDEIRVRHLEACGLRILIIWECEIKQNLKSVVERIRDESSKHRSEEHSNKH